MDIYLYKVGWNVVTDRYATNEEEIKEMVKDYLEFDTRLPNLNKKLVVDLEKLEVRFRFEAWKFPGKWITEDRVKLIKVPKV